MAEQQGSGAAEPTPAESMSEVLGPAGRAACYCPTHRSSGGGRTHESVVLGRAAGPLLPGQFGSRRLSEAKLGSTASSKARPLPLGSGGRSASPRLGSSRLWAASPSPDGKEDSKPRPAPA